MVITKILRFLLMLYQFKKIRLIYKSLLNFVPFFMDTFGVLLILFLFFAGLGRKILY